MGQVTPIKQYPTRYYRMVRELMKLMDAGRVEDLYVIIHTTDGETSIEHFEKDEVNMSLSSRVSMNQDLISATIVDTNTKSK